MTDKGWKVIWEAEVANSLLRAQRPAPTKAYYVQHSL